MLLLVPTAVSPREGSNQPFIYSSSSYLRLFAIDSSSAPPRHHLKIIVWYARDIEYGRIDWWLNSHNI